MKHNLITSSLLAAITLSTPVIADTNKDADEQILVTASRTQQDSFLALSSNQIIDKTDIAKLQANSVGEILKTVAGLQLVNQGDAGQNTSVFTRGTNSNHTLILIDGVRVNSATLGTTNIASMSAQHIERIEIVKGPRAALWGSDAIGGVIQIFTKQYAEGEGIVSIGAGNNGYFEGSASIGLGNAKNPYTVNISREKSDGFNAYVSDPENANDLNEPDSDGYARTVFSLNGQHLISDAFALNVAGRYEESTSEFDGSYPDKTCWYDATQACPDFYANEQDASNFHLKLGGVYTFEQWTIDASAAKARDRGERYGNGIEKYEAEVIETVRDQLSFVANYQHSDTTGVTLGADWYNESIYASADLDSWSEGKQSYQEDERDVTAVFAQGRHQVDSFLLEAALRYDDVENIDSEVTHNISVGYQLSDNWLVSLNTGTGFKVPTFNDLYWPGSGNPDLVSETSTTHELLVRARFSPAVVEVSVYDTEVDNLIAWAPTDAGWKPSNVNKATMQGVDLNIDGAIDDLSYKVALSYVDAEDDKNGKPLLRRPEFTGAFTLNYQWNDWSFGTTATYRDESKDSGDVTLDDYWLVDLTTSYQVTESMEVQAKVVNAFDEDYESALNYRGDDTSYRVKVSYTF